MTLGQGHGIEGRFLGLPDTYCNEAISRIVIVPIPFDLTTTYQKGSDKGPEALIEASRNLELYDIETNSQVYLKGIYTDQPVLAESSEEMVRLTYERISYWLTHNLFTVSIGGEHTISYGAIKAYAEKYPGLTVLQLDAHADLQPAYEGNSLSHASVMARVKEIPQVKDIVSVGIRSMSHEEVPFADPKKIFYAHDLEGNWMDRVLDLLSGPVYVTFDLDVFDCSLMPSTGTPEPGGLFWNETVRLMQRVFQNKTVVGFDIVELCPNSFNPAPDFVAAKLVYKLLSYQFENKK